MTENKYLIFVIMAVTLLYAGSARHRSNKKLCIQVVTIILTLFSGLRSWRMGDMKHYCYLYLTCNLPDWKLDFTNITDSAGLQLLFRLTGQLGISFEGVVFITAAFVAIVLAVLVYRYSPSPYWSYVMFLAMSLYLGSMDLMKQTIAMAFCMLAMMEIIEERPVRFLLWVGAAWMFHYPALIFLIAYPMACKKVDGKYWAIVAAMVAAVFLFRDEIIGLAAELYYEEGTEFTATGDVGTKTIVMVLILVMGLILRPLRNYDSLYRKVFTMMVLAALIQYFSMYDNVFTRLADYYYQFVVLFFPLILQPGREQAKEHPNHTHLMRYWDRNTYRILNVGITLFAIWFYFNNINGSYALLQEFQFVWEVTSAGSRELLEEMLLTYGAQ